MIAGLCVEYDILVIASLSRGSCRAGLSFILVIKLLMHVLPLKLPKSSRDHTRNENLQQLVFVEIPAKEERILLSAQHPDTHSATSFCSREENSYRPGNVSHEMCP